MAITSILVANRGEIACRIMRTVRSLGLRSIAVFSEADAGAPHVAMADDAVWIGPSPVGESYLCIEKLLAAAHTSKADAIHPGYGFLSENAAFAAAVTAAGLCFLGPPTEAMRAMGNKAEAKRRMRAAKVPCVPGYEGQEQSTEAFVRAAQDIGFPVMIKAAAGGGGRGMRLVHRADDLPSALSLARSEAANAFGADQLILEKALLHPRHVEVQIFADTQGHCIHLGERDCSIQRRHQKVIEEAPCPVMTPALRQAMGAAAVAAAQSVGYCGAGTVEFLLDAEGAFYFLEMNTRLQVEHPVTELITGLDLVALQIAVANGEPLPLRQEDVALDGHAIEARLYAEDPANGYLPVTGRIELWSPACGDGVRVDAGISQGQEVSPFYDPMLAKVMAWGPNREVARARLIRALKDTVLFGTTTNTTFLVEVLSRRSFAEGHATTAFLHEEFPDGVQPDVPERRELALAAALIMDAQQKAAFHAAGYVTKHLLGWSSAVPLPIPVALLSEAGEWTMTATARGQGWEISFGDERIQVELLHQEGAQVRAVVGGQRVSATAFSPDPERLMLAVDARRFAFRLRSAKAVEDVVSDGAVKAPMPGLLLAVHVQEGQEVAKGDVLAVLEAMKMQHQILAPISGKVSIVAAQRGIQVASGDLMFALQEPESPSP